MPDKIIHRFELINSISINFSKIFLPFNYHFYAEQFNFIKLNISTHFHNEMII